MTKKQPCGSCDSQGCVRLGLFLRRRVCENVDGDEDDRHADDVVEGEMGADPDKGENARGDRLDRSDDARLHRTDLGDAGEKCCERENRADDDEPAKGEHAVEAERWLVIQRARQKREHDAADEHAEPRHRQAAPALDDADGDDVMGSEKNRRRHAPGEPSARDSEGCDVAVGSDEKNADENAHEGRRFTPGRQTSRCETDVEEHERRAAVLQHRRRAAVGVGDGCEIGVLHRHHADDSKKEQRPAVALVAQNAKQRPALAARQRDENEQQAGGEQTDRGEPFAVGAVGLEQMLAAGAGKSPADGGDDRQQNVLELQNISPFLFFAYQRDNNTGVRKCQPGA